MAGITTDNCVRATARDAAFETCPQVIVSDACAAGAYPDAEFGAMPSAETRRATV